MGCGCGKKKNRPEPVTAETPNPNPEGAQDSEAWWQANPPIPPTAAVPMPS